MASPVEACRRRLQGSGASMFGTTRKVPRNCLGEHRSRCVYFNVTNPRRHFSRFSIMQPKEAIECKTHLMLKERLRADLRVHRDAVEALHESTGGGFEKAHKHAEIARIAYEAARDRFNAHVATHKCEVRYLRYH